VSLYLEKAASGAMQGALPGTSAPNPMGRHLAWKQERAALSPGRRLFSLEIDKWSLRVHLLDGTLDVWADVGQGPPLTFGSLLCFCIFIK